MKTILLLKVCTDGIATILETVIFVENQRRYLLKQLKKQLSTDEFNSLAIIAVGTSTPTELEFVVNI